MGWAVSFKLISTTDLSYFKLKTPVSLMGTVHELQRCNATETATVRIEKSNDDHCSATGDGW